MANATGIKLADVIARYAGSGHFLSLALPDAGWPGPPALDVAVDLDAPMRAALVAELARAWRRVAA